VENVLPPDWIEELKADLDRALEGQDPPERHAQMRIKLQKRMFEQSAANLRLFGVEPIVTFAERLIGRDDPPYGADGVHVIHNNQARHRGGPNRSGTIRYITQVSYARRIIGHMYFPFMGYVMPEHVVAGADPRLRRLLGFLPTGAYG